MNTLSTVHRKALVTGASSGLGEAFATMLVQDGVEVWTLSRRAPTFPGADASRHRAVDLSNRATVEELLADDTLPWDTFDLLINNAGAGTFCPIDTFPEKVIEPQLFLMLEAPIRLTRKVLPYRVAAGKGTIVNVSSMAARFPLPCHALYNAAKAGLSGFSRSLLDEMNGSGVVVIDFQPGDYLTPFNSATVKAPHLLKSPKLLRVWERLEQNLHNGPAPEQAARDLKHILLNRQSGTFRSGGFFQKWVAPFGQTLLPDSIFRRLQRKYFRLEK